jgi:hypothetical protein
MVTIGPPGTSGAVEAYRRSVNVRDIAASHKRPASSGVEYAGRRYDHDALIVHVQDGGLDALEKPLR